MTLAELSAVCDKVEAQGLPFGILAAPRLRDGKRIPPPKRIDGALAVTCVGGKVHDWLVSFRVADARAYIARRANPSLAIPLRDVQPAEKMSREMRRMCGVEDPPADPWAAEAERLRAALP